MFALSIHFEYKIDVGKTNEYGRYIPHLIKRNINEVGLFKEDNKEDAIKFIITTLITNIYNEDEKYDVCDRSHPFSGMVHSDEKPTKRTRDDGKKVLKFKKGCIDNKSDVYRWVKHNNLTLETFIEELHASWRSGSWISADSWESGYCYGIIKIVNTDAQHNYDDFDNKFYNVTPQKYEWSSPDYIYNGDD